MRRKFLAAAFLLGATVLSGCAVRNGYYVRNGPPPPRYGARGVAPSRGYVWADGYWDLRRDNWYWAPGRWVRPPRPGARWDPPRWQQHGRGQWRFNRGRWR